MRQIIAIQGYEGSFHHAAAEKAFGRGVGIQPCASFREVVAQSEDNKTAASVLAIENSIAGSILPNYRLLQQSKLQITGEVYLPIKQHLLVNDGVMISDIKEVHSHPMAIQQCMDFLSKHPWKLVETEDTALSAQQVHQRKLKHTAAIAGKRAADLYGLSIAANNIHTEKKNYTRFLILQKPQAPIPEADKASIAFETSHAKGSLAMVLQHIAAAGINLSKLQSMPVPGSNFLYRFYADLEFESNTQMQQVLQVVKQFTKEVKVFGFYKNGKQW